MLHGIQESYSRSHANVKSEPSCFMCLAAGYLFKASYLENCITWAAYQGLGTTDLQDTLEASSYVLAI